MRDAEIFSQLRSAMLSPWGDSVATADEQCYNRSKSGLWVTTQSSNSRRLPDRRMGVATARPSASVPQATWRTTILAVGRFGGWSTLDAKHNQPTARAPQQTRFQWLVIFTSHPSAIGACRIVGWAWRQPARLRAYRKPRGVRPSSQSVGLADGVLERRSTLDAKHNQPTARAPQQTRFQWLVIFTNHPAATPTKYGGTSGSQSHARHRA